MVESINSSDLGTQAAGSVSNPKHDEGCSEVIRKSWRDFDVHTYVKIFIISGLFCWLYNHEISKLVGQWSDPSWSHGILIPLFSLYFVNQHKREILNLDSKPNYLGLFFLICGVIFYALNIVHFQYGYLGPVSMIATLGAIVLFLGGWPLLKYTWLPIGFLIFAVPLPQRYYVSMTLPMRFLAAQVSAALLNLVSGIDATVNGVVISIAYKGRTIDPPLNVAEACSGMRLLLAFLALGVAMAYLHYRPIWQRIVLLVSTIPIAITCNVVRVAITGFIHTFISPKYAEGVYHDMLGLMMLPLAFGLYYFLAWFMSSLFVEETESDVADVVVRKGNR